MIKEALEYIVNLSAPHLEFRNGSHYADRTLHRIPNELTVHTSFGGARLHRERRR